MARALQERLTCGAKLVERCPECGSPLQTLDLPCPVCAFHGETSKDLQHTFSKTFEIRTAYRYKPEELVEKVNTFLWLQHTVDRLSTTIHRDRQGLVKGMTLTCVAGSEPASTAFQFARIRLVTGDFLPRKRQDVGVALNDWMESHPSFRLANTWTISMNGRPVEVWVLYLTRRQTPIEISSPNQTSPS
jgi:hypothetical protein